MPNHFAQSRKGAKNVNTSGNLIRSQDNKHACFNMYTKPAFLCDFAALRETLSDFDF